MLTMAVSNIENRPNDENDFWSWNNNQCLQTTDSKCSNVIEFSWYVHIVKRTMHFALLMEWEPNPKKKRKKINWPVFHSMINIYFCVDWLLVCNLQSKIFMHKWMFYRRKKKRNAWTGMVGTLTLALVLQWNFNKFVIAVTWIRSGFRKKERKKIDRTNNNNYAVLKIAAIFFPTSLSGPQNTKNRCERWNSSLCSALDDVIDAT